MSFLRHKPVPSNGTDLDGIRTVELLTWLLLARKGAENVFECAQRKVLEAIDLEIPSKRRVNEILGVDEGTLESIRIEVAIRRSAPNRISMVQRLRNHEARLA